MAKAKKRLVKNPESFRQKISNTDQSEDKKSKTTILNWPFKGLAKLFRPVGNTYRKLSKVKSLKPVFTVFKWIGLALWPPYFRNSFNELKGVTWPGPKLSVRLTYAVLAFAVIFGVAVALVDFGLDKVFKNLLLK